MKKILALWVLLIRFTTTITVAQNTKLLESYKSHLNDLDTWEQKYSDDYRFDSLEAINKRLKYLLVSNPSLFNADVSNVTGRGSIISTSENKKVRIYCWDDRTGGTMRSANSVVQY